MKCLLVIDMQEDYVGPGRNKKRYSYDAEGLIRRVNGRILTYPAESVVYITNRFVWEFGTAAKKLVDGLAVVSKNIYEKKKSSGFSNEKLSGLLREMGADTLELVGVDGNYCVASTALDGIARGFSVICNRTCIGVSKPNRFAKTYLKLAEKGVQFI